MSDNYERLRKLLDELFEFDHANLDFGIYRVMNVKRTEIRSFLDEKLLPQVREVLGGYRHEDRDRLQRDLEALQHTLDEVGVSYESSPKYTDIRRQLDALPDPAALEADVYGALYGFFRRYYKDGDFLSLRRYKEGVYAIPYEGEEVKLHWANADQYYVKTSEQFQDYRFRLPDDRHVHFRLVQASTERDNNKAASDQQRRFALRDKDFYAIDGDELTLRFEYKPLKEKREVLDAEAARRILECEELAAWHDGLHTIDPTPKKPNRTLLERNLDRYTASNTFDYFIQKDLDGFLRRELDFYLKNEVLHLDDLTQDSEARVLQQLSKARAIKSVGEKIIIFLAQIEDFQKQLYLKKKFVVSTDYCITLDRVPETLYEAILTNNAQFDEWGRLFAISERILPLLQYRTVDWVKSNLYLVLDTRFFDTSFKDTLLESFDDIECAFEGLLINADNFQALSLLERRYRERVKCFYIDPPYNTGPSEILYKNNYKHSSWLSLMESRLRTSSSWMMDDGTYVIAIDDAEMVNLCELTDQEFPDYERNMIVVNHHPQGSGGDNVSRTHEYAIVLTPSERDLMRGNLQEAEIEHRPYMRSGQAENNFRWGRANSFFAILVDPETFSVMGAEPPPDLGSQYPTGETAEGWKRVYPMSADGTERVWRNAFASAVLAISDKRIISSSTFTIYQIIDKGAERGVVFSNWTDKKYNAGTQGTNLVADILGDRGLFSYPKSLYTVRDLIEAATTGEEDALVVDYFSGSGTTGHAVIMLNREDQQHRKYVLVEMGEYFDTVLKPRIEKVIYSKDWKGGKPVSRDGVSHAFKYLTLESYEDTLNNLTVTQTTHQQRLGEEAVGAYEQYMLSYLLAFDTQGSPSLLDVDALAEPDSYTLKITHGGETLTTRVDLVETFNYLLGLRVQKMRVVDGIRTVEGIAPDGERALVIWRNVHEHDDAALHAFFAAQGYGTRPPETALRRIYVNGDNTLMHTRRDSDRWQVLLTEAYFKELMFAGSDR